MTMGAMKNLHMDTEVGRLAVEYILRAEKAEDEIERLREALRRIRGSCEVEGASDHEDWIWRTAEQALKAGETP
jgi:hypothetical protein